MIRPDVTILRALMLAEPITDAEAAYIGIDPSPDEDPAITRLRRALVMSARANGVSEDPAADLAWIDDNRTALGRDHLRARVRR